MSIRVTTEQAKLLFGQPKPAAPGVRMPRTRKPKDELPENIVEDQITGYLGIHGWTVTRQQSGLFRNSEERGGNWVRVGKKGESDWRCERLLPPRRNPHEIVSQVELFYLEVKGYGKEPNEKQLQLMHDRLAVGITAVWFDSFNEFRHWYQKRYPKESA